MKYTIEVYRTEGATTTVEAPSEDAVKIWLAAEQANGFEIFAFCPEDTQVSVALTGESREAHINLDADGEQV